MKKLLNLFQWCIAGMAIFSLNACIIDSDLPQNNNDHQTHHSDPRHPDDQDQQEQNQQQQDSIPFSKTPVIPEMSLPQEAFVDELEEEASAIIDASIEKALAYVSVMKDARHSTMAFPYDEDANGFLDALSQEELEIYDKIVAAAKKGEPFLMDETEYDGELKDVFFAVSTPLNQLEPAIESYFTLDASVTISGEDYVSHYKNIFSIYYDPYQDANVTVAKGNVTQEEVMHGVYLLDRVVKRIVRFMPVGLSTYDQYYYLAAVISEQVTYDKSPKNCYTAFGALITGKAVCEGYAAAFQLLCREAGLWSAYRYGQPRGQGHVWNMIKLDDGIYNVDVTWADGSGLPYEIDWYDSFIKSDEVFEDDGHNATSGVEGTGNYTPSPYEE